MGNARHKRHFVCSKLSGEILLAKPVHKWKRRSDKGVNISVGNSGLIMVTLQIILNNL